MKLIQHTLKIRHLITQALSNRMERLGLCLEDKHGAPPEMAAERSRVEAVISDHQGEGKSYDIAREEVLNEYVFTLFNRIAAIKVMENRKIFPEVIRQRAENAGRSFEHNAWLEVHPDMRHAEREGLREMLQSKFDWLGEKLPIFRSDYPYAMMPTADELQEIITAFNAIDDDPECDKNWSNDDILGWLYENFNAVEKEALKSHGEKIEYDKVSLQSQVYTPKWVVKFLVDNTLMKMYLEMYPDSELRSKYMVANTPTERVREPKDVRQWRLIDPAQGSGNFLVYSLEVFYDIYLDQIENYDLDVSRREIPKLILEKNIYGIDLDKRAAQLSQISLYIKAWQLGGNRMKFPEHLNIVSTNFILPDWEEIELAVQMGCEWEPQELEALKKVWGNLKDAPKFGSLIRVEETLEDLKPIDEYNLFAEDEKAHRDLFDFKMHAIDKLREQLNRIETSSYSLSKVNDAMTFLEILINKFDVAVANPPYTDSSDFGQELKAYIEENYRKPYKVNVNLYGAFIKRVCELVTDKGKVGMVNPPTFMYIKSFEDLRKFLLNEMHIDIFVEWGYLGMFSPSARVDSAMYILDKDPNKNKLETTFIKLNDLYEGRRYDVFVKVYESLCDGIEGKFVYHLPQSKLKEIKSWPFIYWISDDFRKKFSESILENYLNFCTGSKSGDNNRFIRFWWEVDFDKISEDYKVDRKKWTRHTKGGPYCKWYGNNWTLINWENDAEEIRNLPNSTLRNTKMYFQEGLTYSSAGSKAASFRYLPFNYTLDASGSGAYPTSKFKDFYYGMGVLNTILVAYIISCLNPTVNNNVGDFNRIPFVIPGEELQSFVTALVKSNIQIKKHLCEFSLIEQNFKENPISFNGVENSLLSFYEMETGLLTQVLINEAIINEKVFDIYELTEHDRQMVLDKEGMPVGSLPVSQDAKEAYLDWICSCTDFPPTPEAKAYIEALPINDEQEKIKDWEILFQSHNEWEEFCIRHNVSPIEAWYQFRKSGVLPPQRTQELAFELVTDVIRRVLETDDDGIIPLVQRAGEEHLAPRIENEMIERGYSSAAISQVYALLGMPIDKYLLTKFFQQLSDRLNLFMYLPKTPFIWHLSSGPCHALEVYISIYRWSRNNLSRVKSIYASNRESGLRDRLAALAGKDDPASREEAENIKAQLAELKQFCERIDNLMESGYEPKLDDGVGKNIAPLQARKMLAYEVLNQGQLEKYLNADW